MPYVEASGVKINFPYDPYPCQIAYMDKVVKSLQTGTNAILESPTGTGKTLCLLCSCLAWLENKKAQIGNNKWLATNSELHEDVVKENYVSDYRNELTKMLDKAAGSWNENMGAPKIIYASRTHSQLNQAMQEFKKTSYRYLKACVIGSREQLCIHPQVAKEPNNTTKVHMCRAKVSKRSCHFANQVETFKTHAADMVLDIEDLVGVGQKNNVCPYYLSKELKREADLIFMPYNYLLDPKSRKAQGVELQGNILIFDEAHNLERICEESASFDLSSTDLAAAISDINRIIQKVQEWQTSEITPSSDSETSAVHDYSLEEVLAYKKCLLDLEEKIDSMEISSEEGETFPGDKLFEILSQVGLTPETGDEYQQLTEKMITTLTADVSNSVFISKGGGLAKFGDVMQVIFPKENKNIKNYIESASRHYKVHLKEEVAKLKKKADPWNENVLRSVKKGRVLSYWCFNPGYTMADLKNNGVKVIILTSGTLSPLQSFITEFGMDFPVRLENSHVIDSNQVWIGSLGKGPTDGLLSSAYDYRFKPEYMKDLGYTISNFSRIIPKGVLVFFPSYPLMEKCLDFWKSCGLRDKMESCKPLFVEPKAKSEFSLAMLGFYEKIQDPTISGAIFMAVCRGKVSEGLDFADNNGRGVIITGLPYPPMMDARVKLKMQFLDETRKTNNGLSGQEWYRLQASRAVNQAIGRVIRHKNDFGAILLCDTRFSKFDKELPVWLKEKMIKCNNFGEAQFCIKRFFKNFESEIANVPQVKAIKSKENEPCSSFELIGNASKRVPKASDVIVHYGSRDDDTEDLLARYSKSDRIINNAIQPKRDLLSALNSAEDSSRVAVVKPFKSEEGLQSCSKKNAFSNVGIKTEVQAKEEHSEALQHANNLIQDLKKVFSKETYSEFKKLMHDYKTHQDVNKLLETIEKIFDILDPRNLFVIVGVSKLVRPKDREFFHELCSKIIGPSFEEACKQSLPPIKKESLPPIKKESLPPVKKESVSLVKKESLPSKSPPNKRFKLETNNMTTQPKMENFFLRKDNEPQKKLTPLGSLVGAGSSNLDSKSHLQSGRHLSTLGMKLQPRPSPSDGHKASSPKANPEVSTDADSIAVSMQKGCPICRIGHDGPLAKSSKCGHSCCRMCWERLLASTKACSVCGCEIRRRHIKIGYFCS